MYKAFQDHSWPDDGITREEWRLLFTLGPEASEELKWDIADALDRRCITAWLEINNIPLPEKTIEELSKLDNDVFSNPDECERIGIAPQQAQNFLAIINRFISVIERVKETSFDTYDKMIKEMRSFAVSLAKPIESENPETDEVMEAYSIVYAIDDKLKLADFNILAAAAEELASGKHNLCGQGQGFDRKI